MKTLFRGKTPGELGSYVKANILSTWLNARCVFRILATPRHARYLFRWLRSRSTRWSSTDEPWITYEAIDFLSGLALSGKNVFEYGSGTSTIFWMKRGAHCISIEHDAEWYARIKPLLEEPGGVDYRLVPPQHRLDLQARDPANPHLFVSADEEMAPFEFKDYVTQIDAFPNEYFDILFIDGRARPSCIQRAYVKVKLGGMLVLDNSDREYYLRNTIVLLSGFERIVFRGPTPRSHLFSETSVFVRVS